MCDHNHTVLGMNKGQLLPGEMLRYYNIKVLIFCRITLAYLEWKVKNKLIQYLF